MCREYPRWKIKPGKPIRTGVWVSFLTVLQGRYIFLTRLPKEIKYSLITLHIYSLSDVATESWMRWFGRIETCALFSTNHISKFSMHTITFRHPENKIGWFGLSANACCEKDWHSFGDFVVSAMLHLLPTTNQRAHLKNLDYLFFTLISKEI